MAVEDVILHIYELGSGGAPDVNGALAAADDGAGDAAAAQQAAPAPPALLPVLRNIGMAPYHTSLEVHGKVYSFAAGRGVVQSNHPPSTLRLDEHAPPSSTYLQRVVLGTTDLSRGEVNEVVLRMRSAKFNNTSYHLLNRNCNHFTRTMAKTLLFYDRLAGGNAVVPEIATYPKWVNRLARTGTWWGCWNGTPNLICDVDREAVAAAGGTDRVGWDLGGRSSAGRAAGGTSGKKKELTEKQKRALSKLKPKR